MDHVVVIGGGTMGAGIAQTFLTGLPHCRVHLVEVDQERVTAAQGLMADGLARYFKRSPARDADIGEVLSRLELHHGDSRPSDADCIIEAVPENVSLKRSVLAAASTHWPDALIATNTSSLSITELASAVSHSERFLGMHFFNPVPRAQLVEIIHHPATSAATREAARDLVGSLGKHSIEVRDSPGFGTSRLGVLVGLEAIRMVEEGVASAADIDAGMRLGYRYPVGPLELTDLVGLDVRLDIADHLAGELGPRFDAPQLLRDLVAAGDLGVKTGRGFYEWVRDESGASVRADP